MLSNFAQLFEKISQLAVLTDSLREENAALRRRSVGLVAENAELARRMQEAHDRTTALLQWLPDEPTIEQRDTEESA